MRDGKSGKISEFLLDFACRILFFMATCLSTGTMEVKGMKFTGLSPGNFETLDLQQPFYVGGHSNYSFIQQVANINVGFEGDVIFIIWIPWA